MELIQDDVREKSNTVFFLSGRLISLFGTQIYDFAMALYILKITGSALSFATTAIISMLPRIILGPIAGIAADRIDRKKMIIIMDVLSGLMLFGFLLISYEDSFRIEYIYISAFLLTTFNTFFDTAVSASVPNIVYDNNLMRLNSLNEGIRSISSILGPVLGGIVFGIIDMKLFILINAISFIVSAVIEGLIDFKLNKIESTKENPKEKFNFLTEIKDGFKFLKSYYSVYILFSFVILINFLFAFGLNVPMAYIMISTLGMSSKEYGILQGLFPVGMLVGSIVISILPEQEKKYKMIFAAILTMSILLMLFSVPAMKSIFGFSNIINFIYYAIVIVFFGICIMCVNIPINVTMQRLIPDDMRGRIMGLLNTMCISMIPLGMLLSGICLKKISSFTLPLVSGLILILLTFAFFTNKKIREL